MLHWNLIANYLGYAVRAVVGIVFVPLYIHFLGMEAYGLIALYALLQTWLGILDVGMRPALSREMARFTAGAVNVEMIRDLLRSVELITLAMAVIAVGSVVGASGWLATQWVSARTLPAPVVGSSIAAMGVVVGLRFIESVYSSTLSGLQLQVRENAISTGIAVFRSGGAAVVLLLGARTVVDFFLWQGLTSLLAIAALSLSVYGALPSGGRKARFSSQALTTIWKFAAGSMIITVLSLILTSADKVILSHLLSLEAFGYYALAASVATQLYAAANPISTAFYPRLTQLVATGDETGLKQTYHQAAQYVAVATGSVAAVLMAFSEPVLAVWTHDAHIAAQVAPLMRTLLLGMALHCLMWMPYYLQLAHGWTSLAIRVNLVAVLVLFPAVIVVAPRYGGLGTAWIWVALNAGYLLFTIALMHRRLLPTEMLAWTIDDVVKPLGAAAVIVMTGRWLMPPSLNAIGQILWIAAVSATTLGAAAAAAPIVRGVVMDRLSLAHRRLSRS